MTAQASADDDSRELETKEFPLSSLPVGVIQAAYKEITETTETISKSFEPGRKITRDDIRSFCNRLTQTCEQYQTKGMKATFVIRREDDHTEKFTSLDRFLASDAKGSKRTSGISVEMRFLVKPPNFEKYQEYKLNLGIDSADYLSKPRGESFILSLMGLPSFLFSVEYVDYSVARTFLAAAEEWYDELPKVKASPVLNFIKKHFNPFTDLNLYSQIGAWIAVSLGVVAVLEVLPVWDVGERSRDLIAFLAFALVVIYTSRFVWICCITLLVKQIDNIGFQTSSR